MDEKKEWMLMTYYCPTHGDSGSEKVIQRTNKEISKTFLKKVRSSKPWFFKIKLRYWENVLKFDWNLVNQKLMSCKKVMSCFLISSIGENIFKEIFKYSLTSDH